MHLHHSVLIEVQYFPPIEYFSLFCQNKYDCVIFEAHENYQKGSYRNRCHIANSTGLQVLSVPLRKGKNQNQSIREVMIAYNEDWQKQHWQSLRTAYGSAPFWDYYAPQFEIFFKEKYDCLFDLNIHIIEALCKMLKLNKSVKTSFSNDYELLFKDGADFRNAISPKKNVFKGERYAQLFQEKTGFIPNLSVLDLLFCAGPQAVDILKKSNIG